MPVLWAVDGDVLNLTFQGEYSFEDIAAAARAGLAAVAGPVRLLVDATPTARLPDAKGVKQRIALLREVQGRLAGAVAIVATPGAMYGVARQIGQQAEVPDTLTVRVFDRLAEAQDWMARGSPPE
jgi:SpoIIAA-like